ncbi:MAG: SDR family NAD(P)-dependent oxidoreductase, partial [Spirochaetaceae bacterium]|nr:SDR family NAD(P)-dependent oxidoreductase [Spirochaetaceae bacterium]
MTAIDLSGKTALITGGTGGIGLATALELGAAGANTVITYRWGSTEEEVILKLFADRGAPKPLVLEADVSREEDTGL